MTGAVWGELSDRTRVSASRGWAGHLGETETMRVKLELADISRTCFFQPG